MCRVRSKGVETVLGKDRRRGGSLGSAAVGSCAVDFVRAGCVCVCVCVLEGEGHDSIEVIRLPLTTSTVTQYKWT